MEGIVMAEFATAYTSSVKMKVPVTADGNIAQSGDTVTSATKQISIPGIKAAATLAEANTVFNAFVGDIGCAKKFL